MFGTRRRAGFAAVVSTLITSLPLQAAEVSDYKIEDLLSPCVESDNDARWGAAAEAECEQHLRGFTDAFILHSRAGEVCLPDLNRDDEVRWAFMKWSTQNYEKRHLPAAQGLMTTLKEAFPCE